MIEVKHGQESIFALLEKGQQIVFTSTYTKW